MRFNPAVVMLLACLSGAACSSSPKGRVFAAGLPRLAERATSCPLGVPGSHVRVSDIEDGVVINLRTYGDERDVRRRARDAAAMYGFGAHRGLGHDGVHGAGHQHGLALSRIGVPVEAEEEDTAEGARIIVRPKDATDLERLRVALHERGRRAQSGECP